MFTRDFLGRGEAKLTIAALTALVLALTLLLAVSALPAHATQTPPGTDSFAAAPELFVNQQDPPGGDVAIGEYRHRGNTSGATMEVGEPRPYSSTKDCGIFGISNSVWWKVTVHGSYTQYIKLSTQASSFDTVLAVYQGSSLTSLRQVACSNDNSLPNWNDRLYAALPGGQTYYVQLAGTGGARSGYYELTANWISSSEYWRAKKL